MKLQPKPLEADLDPIRIRRHCRRAANWMLAIVLLIWCPFAFVLGTGFSLRSFLTRMEFFDIGLILIMTLLLLAAQYGIRRMHGGAVGAGLLLEWTIALVLTLNVFHVFTIYHCVLLAVTVVGILALQKAALPIYYLARHDSAWIQARYERGSWLLGSAVIVAISVAALLIPTSIAWLANLAHLK